MQLTGIIIIIVAHPRLTNYNSYNQLQRFNLEKSTNDCVLANHLYFMLHPKAVESIVQMLLIDRKPSAKW
jgi:hypothetical protein